MKIDMKPGTYVVAVSGGVDSMVLLDILAKLPKLKLIVAHFDHGIRPDSAKDRLLAQKTAKDYGLMFVYDNGNLGPNASEAVAREARYKFLNKVKKASGARAIITAHHQDDLIETAIINVMRGTHRRGLTSLKSGQVIRPLISFPKSEILEYAKNHNVKWREDSTNQDTKYLRNYVRQKIMPALIAEKRKELLAHLDKLSVLNQDIDGLLMNQVGGQRAIDRTWFVELQHNLAREVMAAWLNSHGVKDLDKKLLELLVKAGKTYAAGKKADVDKHHVLEVKTDVLALSRRER